MCCNVGQAQTGLAHFPHTGHPWPGQQWPGMRGLYAHVSPRMREDLIAALQARWENSLRERASIDPRSPVLLLDNLLAPFRAGQKKTISQIPPRTATAPILSVG